jgi:hypothetical protein
MNRPPQMACRQCRQPLNTLGDPAAPTYVHPAHKGPTNHQPDPIPIGDLDTIDYVCDFCGDGFPLWSLLGGEIRTVMDTGADKLIQDYGQRWSACAACEADADTGCLDAIVDRATKAMNIQYAGGREQLTALHHAFLDNRQAGRHLVTTPLWPPAPLTAHNLPKVRDRLTPLLADPDQLPDHLPDDHTTTIADHLDQAALFYVDSDFTDLADHATTDLPASPLHPDDLPTTHGLVVWARPVTDRRVHAATWTTVHNGLLVAAYRSIGTGLPPVLLQRTREQVGWLAPIRTLHLTAGQAMPAGHPVAALAATCLLIAQQLADTTVVEPDKNTRRGYARTDRPVPEVRLVRIKGRAGTRTPGTTARSRAGLDHREWVGGHWKQQVHGPGRTQRRLIYVAPYLRGPEDQPIRTSTTVRVLGTLPPRPGQEPDN